MPLNPNDRDLLRDIERVGEELRQRQLGWMNATAEMLAGSKSGTYAQEKLIADQWERGLTSGRG